MKKSTLILLISTAIFFTSTLYLLFLNFQKPKETVFQTKIPTIIPTKTIDPTTNWKTYTNNKYGFSFQYDNTKHLLENISADQNNISSYSQYYNLDLRPEGLVLWKGLKTEAIPEESITMHFNPDQLFSVQIFKNNLSPEEFVKRLCASEYGPDYLKNSGFKKIDIDGQVLYYFNSGGIGQGTFQYVFFNENNIVSFNTSELSNTYETNPEFAQILSTFKFITLDKVVSDEQNLIKVLQNSIYPKSPEKVKIVSTIQNNFASGTYRIMLEADGGPGGGWIAAKPSGKWVLVEAFQEPPSCLLMKQYNVPKSIYGGCIEKYSLNDAKSACISLQGQKAWDSNFSECNEAGTTKDQLKNLCDQYGGVFYPDSSTCRHTDFYGSPCGPEATYYCSFSNLK